MQDIRGLVLSCGVLLAGSVAHAANWVSKAPLREATEFPAVGTIDGIVYVAGGLNGVALSNLQAFDPTHNRWHTLASMPGVRYQGDGADQINGQLYVAGGWTTSPPLPNSNLWRYDPTSNTWATLASLSHLSGCGATGAINGKLYVTTACDGNSGYSNDLDVYDPAADSWTSLPGSSSAHATGGFGVINGKLYVAGGVNESGLTSVTEVYDPIANAWTTLAPMPTAVQATASVALNGKLYVFGGTSTGAISNVQVYNPVTNIWTSLSTSLPAAISGAGATVDYGIVFVEGGANSGATVQTTNQLLALPPSIP